MPLQLQAVTQGLTEKSILFADIGSVVTGAGVDIIRDAEVCHYSDSHPEEDELARMWVKYSPDEGK